MKSLLSLCLIGLSMIWSNRLSGQAIQTSAVTTIHITADNQTNPLPLATEIYHVFPAYDVSEVQDTLSADRTQTWLSCPVRVAQNGYLTVGQDRLTLWLVPSDTIHIHIASLRLPLTERYRFAGRTRAEQTYYLAKGAEFPTDPAQAAMNAGSQAENLARFQYEIDRLTQSETRFWQHYRQAHALPARFIRFESDAIRYTDGMLRLYMSWYQPDYQKKKQVIPANYFAFLQQLPVRNPAAQYDYAYLNFLREFIGYKVKTSTASGSGRAPDQAVVDRITEQLLGPDLDGFFRLWTISFGAQADPERARTELAGNKFPAKYAYLRTYLNQRSAKKAAVLAPGDKAPGFFLPDTRDSLISLSQFRGQTVYLCFWFATCGACHHEIPYENQLVEQFKDQPVQIVSICTITKPDKWLQTIQKTGLKTVNLLANSAWQKTLEEKYAISVYPHYVLIDAEGRIVENFATRPSRNAAAQIRQVVAKIQP